ncbi:MAG: methyltransferase domain-containing protein [Acidobacteriota bacterium]
MHLIDTRYAPGFGGLRNISAERMPGHWLLASLGKRVLRPGGLELTACLLDKLGIGQGDDVLELAPGLGVTARLTLKRQPASYTAIERDENAARRLAEFLPASGRCIRGNAEYTGLAPEAFSVAYGEAMLTMQARQAKLRILSEVRRLLRRGGRYGIHELCIVPDQAGSEIRNEIQRALSLNIHTGVQPLLGAEWREMLECAGFRVVWEERAPMRLLEPWRLVRDEGLFGAFRFGFNVLRRRDARRRVISMRRLFRKYAGHLEAAAFCCVKE